ncbi:MAG TPA: polyprenyl synthetase family protein [Pseudonocardiaceae bacterium]|nr:polyprenyl synthetase family protein [Pseudonocardiaceae bacterium]
MSSSVRAPETIPHQSGETSHWAGEFANAARIRLLVGLIEQQLSGDWSPDATQLDQICRYAVLPGHKLFRPMLLLESAGAVGGDLSQVLPAAAGAEAGHVASLIHDDIIDGDLVRRGRPAVHAAYGLNDAIIAGDMLIFYLFASLGACGPRGVAPARVADAMAVVAAAGLDLCRGQSMEAILCDSFTCDVAAYITMIRLKTSALFQACCRSGAILAGGTPAQVDALGTYGDMLGVGFQIVDDLLAYTSDSAAMGKAATSDISNRRLTLPFLLARELGGPSVAEKLDAALLDDGDAEQRLDFIASTIRDVGALDTAAEMAASHAEQACDALETLPDTPSRASLRIFVEAAVNRCA